MRGVNNLPVTEFIGGRTTEFEFTLIDEETGAEFSTFGLTGKFTLAPYVFGDNGNAVAPILVKPLVTKPGTAKNIMYATLESGETFGLCGKYYYQLTFENRDGEICVPGRGCLIIAHNLDNF